MAVLPSVLLAALAQAAPADPPAELPSPDAVRSALERVFARPEFHHEKGWFERLKGFLWEKLGDVIEWIFSLLPRGTAANVVQAVFWTLAALLALVLLRLLWTSISTRRKREAAAPPPAAAPAPLGPAAHVASARELAAGGRFREAAHALYRAVLLWLDQEGLVRFEGSKTGGEYARELGSSPRTGVFRALLHAFYPSAFGGREAWSEAYETMRRAATRLGVPE